MIPGSNILNMALTVIAKQTVIYYHALGRPVNENRQYVTQYGVGKPLSGSFQPIPRRLYEVYGLDLQNDYFTFYTSYNVLDVSRDVSGDQIAFGGQRYQCESNTDWFLDDGWKGILCVHIGLDEAATPIFGFGTIPSTNNYFNFGNGNFIGQNT